MAERDSSSPFKKLRPHARWIPLSGIDNRDTESKQRLVDRLLASQDLFDVVRAFISEKREVVNRGEESKDDFTDSAWPYKQAYRAGQRAAYTEIETFLPDPNKHDPE